MGSRQRTPTPVAEIDLEIEEAPRPADRRASAAADLEIGSLASSKPQSMSASDGSSSTTPATAPEGASSPVASEYRISAKWDRCIERFIVNVAAGAAVGAVSGLLLARGKGGRMLITGIGTGWGAGSAYEACNRAFSVDDSK